MESIHETSFASGTPTEEEMKKVAKSERLAVHISNATTKLEKRTAPIGFPRIMKL
ncbi:hypothetical protein DY000_02045461 [Brassica cretica]|uniref:SMP domain-containing protein n=1 Tax=Brassica cretica TaxID=69181 RepID=A0ABQ7EYC4_BRACR|nr:hypothetical protein DY000_02045461 [Brassica cretica]